MSKETEYRILDDLSCSFCLVYEITNREKRKRFESRTKFIIQGE